MYYLITESSRIILHVSSHLINKIPLTAHTYVLIMRRNLSLSLSGEVSVGMEIEECLFSCLMIDQFHRP